MFCFFFLIVLQCYSYSQAGNYSIKTYSVKDGLPDQYILSMSQDSRGFLWIGTANGLSRFDGSHFMNYGFQQGLNNQRVQQVIEDKDHRLWIAAEGKLFELKHDHFVSFPIKDKSLKPRYVYSIQQLKDGTIWAMARTGAYRFNGKEWESSALLQANHDMECTNIIQTVHGDYYNYQDALLKKQTNGSIKQLWAESDSRVYYDQIDYRDNNFYVSGWQGIFKFTENGNRTEMFKERLPHGDWIHFLIDSQNRFWLCRNGSNMIYVSAPGNTEQFTDSIETGSNLFSQLFEDKDHNVWIATVAGLLKVEQQQQAHYSNVKNPLINDIRNIIETSDGKLLAFSRENGILQFNGNTFIKSGLQFYHTNPAAKNDFPDANFTDEKKRIWLVTREGSLLRIAGDHLIDCTHLLHGDSPFNWGDFNPETKKIFLSQDTLNIADERGSTCFTASNDKKLILFPNQLKCFKNGKTIINCESEGIMLIDENNHAINISKELSSANANPGSTFLEDRAGGFWMFGGSYGLKHFHWNKNGLPQNDMNITGDDGPGDAIINNACMDGEGKIWAITSRRLIVIKIIEAQNKILVNQLSDNSNISIEMPVNARLLTAADGRIWVTDKNDIYSFNPGSIVFNTSTAQINIENIDVNFEKTNWEKYTDSFNGYWQLPVNPILKHNENNLQINYTGVSFNNKPDILYSYKLDGLDTIWNKPSTNTFVSYANLPEGRYHFSVKARTPNSEWSIPTAFSFTIRPAFWNTWWFRLFVISIAAVIIISFYSNRIKKIKRETFIKHQLLELEMTALKAQMNPHFIYNALNSIQSLVANDKKDDAVYYIGTFSRLLRQVLDQSENNVISLEKELQTLELYIGLESLRLNMTPNYVVHIANDIQANDEKIPPLTLQPFIENALWHGLGKKEGEKKIILSIYASAGWIICTIEDNGIDRIRAAAFKTSNIIQHQSKAIEITTKRLNDFNDNDILNPVAIEDLYDVTGNSSGTKITLHIRRQN